MKCPNCGNPDAYLGFTNIDCPNNKCKYFAVPKAVAAPPATTSPAPPQSAPSNPQSSAPSTMPSTGSGGGTATLTTLGVSVLSKQVKSNSVLLSFKAWGDPGHPDKRVEFSFQLPGTSKWDVCTLSNPMRYYVDGVDADNKTIYTTHWMCTQDGVLPTSQFTIDARIYP